MFNTIINKRTEYIPYEKTIIEKKAPTDESIKMLNEFREEALKNTMLTFSVKNTLFDASFRYVEYPQTFERKAMVMFKINGKQIIKEIQILEEVKLNSQKSIIEYLIGEWRKIVEEVILNETRDVFINVIRRIK